MLRNGTGFEGYTRPKGWIGFRGEPRGIPCGESHKAAIQKVLLKTFKVRVRYLRVCHLGSPWGFPAKILGFLATLHTDTDTDRYIMKPD